MPRIFVAIPIPIALQQTIQNWRQGYQNFPVRWISGKNLHITLVPPWSADSAQDLGQVIDEFNNIKSTVQPFEIEFNWVSFGLNSKPPNLIWATGQTPANLAKLVQACHESLFQPAPNRPLRLHLTLARFSLTVFEKHPMGFSSAQVSWQMKVDRIVLMQLYLLASGADYEILASVKL